MNSQQSIHRVSHEIKRRKLTVLRVTDITPRMRRITLSGPDLTGFISLGSDDHVKLLFANNAQEQAALENFQGPGSDGPKPVMRDYTPRRYDADSGELDIDFVLHGDGPAATWAAQAESGQFLYIAGPRGSMIVPDMFDSYLLIGDETALPAIARRLEELSEKRSALVVVVEIEDEAERQTFVSKAKLEVIWVLRGQQDLIETTRQLTLPEGQLYAWVATESALSRKLRRVLLDDFKLDEAFVKAAGYWRLDEHEDE
jgi:NADPH-dependent ferric siderophore reductase